MPPGEGAQNSWRHVVSQVGLFPASVIGLVPLVPALTVFEGVLLF